MKGNYCIGIMGRTRGKLVLKPIANERSRKVTFRKRKDGLVKKASELSTLCGVDVCMVCYGPNGELETWPPKEDRSQVLSVIERYNSVSKDERDRRKQDITPFIEAKKKKLEVDLDQACIGNSEFMFPTWDARLDECSEESLRGLGSFLDDKLEKIRAKFELLKVNNKAPNNPKGKDVMVDDYTTRDRIMLAKTELSNYYEDAGMNANYGEGQYQYHWGVRPGMAPIYNPGYGMMDMMVNGGDEMRVNCSYNLPHDHHPSMFHHQPPALRAMFPPMMPMPMQTPMHPSPLQQQPSVPMGPTMPMLGYQHQPHHRMGDFFYNFGYSQEFDFRGDMGNRSNNMGNGSNNGY